MTNSTPHDSREKERPFPFIFSAVMIVGFIIATFVTAGWAFKPVSMSLKAKHWQETPAIITSHYVDARENQYSLKANYSYSWEGTEYNSDRVFFNETVGLRKDYYTNIYHQLSKHGSPSNPIMIWVNPKRPHQAVIFKHIRWDKFGFACFISLCFASFGFGPLWVWLSDKRKARRLGLS